MYAEARLIKLKQKKHLKHKQRKKWFDLEENIDEDVSK